MGEGPALEKTKHVVLDGYRFPVTSNVYLALRETRSSFAIPFKIWIDAICIDQDNPVEKDDQIPLMKEVYSLAKSTMIHLGRGTAEDARILKFINALANPPWVNKTNDWFLTTYNKQENAGQESFVSSSTAILQAKGAELLAYGI